MDKDRCLSCSLQMWAFKEPPLALFPLNGPTETAVCFHISRWWLEISQPILISWTERHNFLSYSNLFSWIFLIFLWWIGHIILQQFIFLNYGKKVISKLKKWKHIRWGKTSLIKSAQEHFANNANLQATWLYLWIIMRPTLMRRSSWDQSARTRIIRSSCINRNLL